MGRLADGVWSGYRVQNLRYFAQKVQDKYMGRLADGVWSGYWVQNLRYFAQKVQDKYMHARTHARTQTNGSNFVTDT